MGMSIIKLIIADTITSTITIPAATWAIKKCRDAWYRQVRNWFKDGLEACMEDLEKE